MRHLTPRDFTAMPWRNGGGVTHEIARREDSGGLLWRISTARVETDAPYSKFEGLIRLSAVVEGKGVTLIDMETGERSVADPATVARIEGDRPVRGKLIDGGIRHLNVIFDPQRIDADMRVVSSGQETLAAGPVHAVYCVAAPVSVGGGTLAPGEVFLDESGKASTVTVGGRAVLISLRRT